MQGSDCSLKIVASTVMGELKVFQKYPSRQLFVVYFDGTLRRSTFRETSRFACNYTPVHFTEGVPLFGIREVQCPNQ